MTEDQIERRPQPERCKHGWRGAGADAPIVTPCPTCGLKSLFIGTGGHLTCASVPTDHTPGCPEPGVERAVEKLKTRLTLVEDLLRRWYTEVAIRGHAQLTYETRRALDHKE